MAFQYVGKIRRREHPLVLSLSLFLCSAKIEWVAEKRQLKEKQKCLEEAEEKAKEELLRAMVNSSQVLFLRLIGRRNPASLGISIVILNRPSALGTLGLALYTVKG